MAPPNKLTEDDVYNIKIGLSEGVRQKDLADRYGIDESMVSKIKNGHYWANVDADVEFVKYQNSWSHRSSNLASKAIQYYKDGYNQRQVSELMNEYILTIDEKIRPKQVNQGNINFILKKYKVKIRRGTGKYAKFLPEMKKLKKEGYRNIDIALKLGIPAPTVSRYLTKKKVK